MSLAIIGQKKSAGNSAKEEAILMQKYAYGIEWNSNNTDPHCTRVGNLEYHKILPIQNNLKGCVAKEGVVQYYLHPDDWSKKEDGTPSVLDGSDGDVCVDTGEDFYIKSFEDDKNNQSVYISVKKINDTWTKVPRILIGAYRATLDKTNGNTITTIKARSVVNTTSNFRGGQNCTSNNTDKFITGVNLQLYEEIDSLRSYLGKPVTSQNRQNMRKYAFNNNAAIMSYFVYKNVIFWLYSIEYANFNSQEKYNPELTSEGYKQGGLGNGLDNTNYLNEYFNGYPLTPCGFGNSLGNNTGIITIPAKTFQYNESTSYTRQQLNMPRWRGFDNPFGDIWSIMDQCTLQNYNLWYCDNPYKIFEATTQKELDAFKLDEISSPIFKSAGTLTHSGGYIRKIALKDTAEFVPINSAGNNVINFCDYLWVNINKNCLSFGGQASVGAGCGLGCLGVNSGVTYSTALCGFFIYFKYNK